MSEFHDYVMGDVLGHLEAITSKRMFGGYGIYRDGVIFAIIVDDELYFKVGEGNKEDYKKEDSHPFIYTGHKTKKDVTMPYWLLPPYVLENPTEIEEWVLKSLTAN